MTGGHRFWERVRALGAAPACYNGYLGILEALSGLTARYFGPQIFLARE